MVSDKMITLYIPADFSDNEDPLMYPHVGVLVNKRLISLHYAIIQRI